MEKLKNFIYDKNDVLIAVIIILAAFFIISGRVEAIMAYPQTMAKQAEEQAKEDEIVPPTVDPGANEVDPNAASGSAVTDGGGDDGSASGEGGSDSQPGQNGGSGKGTAAESSIYIPFNSTWDSVANDLLNAGIIANKQDFINAVHSSGRENKLQVGNFTIPKGSGVADIINIITGAQ